jgi:hypothetical protein
MINYCFALGSSPFNPVQSHTVDSYNTKVKVRSCLRHRTNNHSITNWTGEDGISAPSADVSRYVTLRRGDADSKSLDTTPSHDRPILWLNGTARLTVRASISSERHGISWWRSVLVVYKVESKYVTLNLNWPVLKRIVLLVQLCKHRYTVRFQVLTAASMIFRAVF